MTRAAAGALALCVACTFSDLGVTGRSCPCADEWICHPELGECVVAIDISCAEPGAWCPETTQAGDACPAEDAYLPCFEPADLTCKLGCRTCGKDGTWGACSPGTCGVSGTTEHCSRCGDNCGARAHVVVGECDTGGAEPVCAVSACEPGWIDGNDTAADGCESVCVATGDEVCNGSDDDCDGVVDNEGAPGCMDHYRDQDGDGLGVQADARCLCSPDPPYTATIAGDCDDTSADCTTECVDTDGDVLWDCRDDCVDADGDGFGTGSLDNAGCDYPAVDVDDANASACVDSDTDTCDDCSSGVFDPAADGLDTDSDGTCNDGDNDDDDDTVIDTEDTDPLDPSVCRDNDSDTCDDCAVTGGPPQPDNDGADDDDDGACNDGDPCTDVDGDGVGRDTGSHSGCAHPGIDTDDTDAAACLDSDSDTCDDCSGGDFAPLEDGPDQDTDGLCDPGDPDVDGDGVDEDGDQSGVAGDHPCAGGATTNCDDNCALVANPLQADHDGDGAGDFCDLEVEPLYPSAGADWNDYVANDGADPWHASDSACSASHGGAPNACVHGGEKRRAEAPAFTSCAGLSITDQLDAFDWICDDTGSAVTLLTVALKPSRGLRDLVGSAGWRANRLTVTDGTTTVVSDLGAWWGNAVLPLPSSSSQPRTLEVAGAVYVLPSTLASTGYVIDADRVAVVMAADVELNYTGNTRACSATGEPGAPTVEALVCAGNQSFLWLEGAFNAGSADVGLLLDNVRASQVRQVTVTGALNTGLILDSLQSSRVVDLSVGPTQGGDAIGLHVVGSHHNVLHEVAADHTLEIGIVLESAHDNVLVRVHAVANQRGGVLLDGSQRNTLTHVSATRSTYDYGMHLSAGSDQNTLVQIATLDHGRSGLRIASSNNARVAQLASGGQTFDFSIQLDDASANRFTEQLLLEDRENHLCEVSGGTDPGLADGTCAAQGASDAAVLFTGDASGALESDGFSLSDNDTILRERSGNGLTANDAFIVGSACPPAAHGDRALTDQQTPANTFLVNAFELVLDGVGDDDGLCESNETCAYSPNVGYYQGHGSLEGRSCTFVDGVVSGVTLLGFSSNGY